MCRCGVAHKMLPVGNFKASLRSRSDPVISADSVCFHSTKNVGQVTDIKRPQDNPICRILG